MRNISTWIDGLAHNLEIKLILSTLLGSLVYLVGVDNWSSLGIIAILCGIDFTIAIALCIQKNKRIYSNRLANKFGHFVMYTTGVITMHLLTLLSGQFSALVDIAICLFGFTEAWSIAEHMASMGYKLPLAVLKNIGKE